MSDVVINIKDVSMSYINDKKESTLALSNVNFSIKKGEFLTLLGPSGCGKTTLLRLIADLQQPTNGEILVEGKTTTEARKSNKYGMVFQNPVLFNWRKISKNVAMPLELLKMEKKERNEKALSLLKLVGLEKFKDHFPWQLSGGMQQRVAIARALSTSPEILLMDEPFSALDEFSREYLNDELLKIWEQTNSTVIFVTHSISEAVYLSDRVCVLSPHPGRLSKIIDINLPRKRTPEIRLSNEFNELVKEIKNSFEGDNFEK